MTPDTITAIFSGASTLLTAITALLVAIFAARARKTGEVITARVGEVHDLVNATHSALLDRVARLAVRVAELTGEKADVIEAAAAQTDAHRKAQATEDAAKKRREAEEGL